MRVELTKLMQALTTFHLDVYKVVVSDQINKTNVTKPTIFQQAATDRLIKIKLTHETNASWGHLSVN